MGKGGRFGKYGETKRIARLRQARALGGRAGRREGDLSGPPGIRRERTVHRKQITLREAGKADTDFIRHLSRKVFRIYGPYEELLPLWFESGIAVTLLASMGRRPVGFAMLGRPSEDWHLSLAGELLAIAVEPKRHRSGIGDLLMAKVIERAQKLNMETLILHTAPRNLAAKRLFEKHGFVLSEVKKGFYPEGQDALMMKRDIH